MTAIAMIRGIDGVVIATDAAFYNGNTGELQHIWSKVRLLPDLNCVISARGAGAIIGRLSETVRSATPRTFDGVLDCIGEQTQELMAEYLHYYRDEEGHAKQVDLHIAGWSDERERFETYILCSVEKTLEENNVTKTLAPWTLMPVPALFASPMPDADVAERFGLNLSSYTNAYDAAARIVCAVRSESRWINEDEGIKGCIAGGFLQVTVLQRNSITSEIVHRWPDVIGEPIDPSRGEPLPAFCQNVAK